MKKLNNKPSAGIDNISNKIIKKLPLHTKETLVKLFNQSLVQSTIPAAWKTAVIKMIPKKSVELDNPKSYRPISMISCLGKLLEKLILSRIQNHLKKHKIILKQ